MGTELDIYPCKDSPLNCGWSKVELKAMIWESELSQFCKYPECWCRSWIVGHPSTNKTTEKGQPFISVLYRGSDTLLAERIYNYLRSALKNREIALADSRLSVHVKSVNFEHMAGIYQVDITGELL